MEALLKKVLPFWEDLSVTDRKILLEHTILQTLDKGQFFDYGGGECAGIEIVKTGQVRVFLNSPGGAEITLYRLLPGELCILSAACMIKNLDVEIHMEIEAESEVYVIPRHIFQQISESQLAVKDFLLELVSARFSDVMWLMNQLVFSGMGRRLAQALLERSRMAGSRLLSVTHDGIARDLGTAREVITRLLRQFQLDGLVALSRGNIELLDMEKLSRL